MIENLLLPAVALIAASAPASAQQFKPTKQIEIVVHNGPGSGPDIFGRTVAQIIEQEKLAPVRFQVVNKVGGGGVTAANYMVEKKGDAHTLGVFTSVWMTNPLVQKAAAHQGRRHDADRAAGDRAGGDRGAGGFPYKTLRDVMDAALKDPGKIKQAGGSPLARDAMVRSC